MKFSHSCVQGRAPWVRFVDQGWASSLGRLFVYFLCSSPRVAPQSSMRGGHMEIGRHTAFSLTPEKPRRISVQSTRLRHTHIGRPARGGAEAALEPRLPLPIPVGQA